MTDGNGRGVSDAPKRLMTWAVPQAACSTCPYRRSAPPGVWHPSEYARLPAYDGETHEQPPEPFGCHHGGNVLCGGWLAVHDWTQLLAIRIGVAAGHVDVDELESFDLDQDGDLYQSGTEAWEEGTAEFTPAAEAAAERIEKHRARSAGHRPQQPV